jgi:hypothetical protein
LEDTIWGINKVGLYLTLAIVLPILAFISFVQVFNAAQLNAIETKVNALIPTPTLFVSPTAEASPSAEPTTIVVPSKVITVPQSQQKLFVAPTKPITK